MSDPADILAPPGAVAVIFVAQRTAQDDEGYARAAAAMDALAARQPGYLGIDSVRGADGLGITLSYWADEASALAWARRCRACRRPGVGARALVCALPADGDAGDTELPVGDRVRRPAVIVA